MDIVINIDHNYLPYAIVMFESFFCHNTRAGTCVHLLHASMEEDDIMRLRRFIEKYHGHLQTYKVDKGLFEGFPDLQRWSVETLFRLLIPEVLPKSVERVLYLDVDIIVEKSLEQLFSMDFQGKSMIVCRNTDGNIAEEEKNQAWNRSRNTPYFNAGVMLLNLEKMRKICSFHQYCQAVRKGKSSFPLLDQDLLNYFFGEDVRYVPAEKYNCIIRPESRDFSEKVSIYHFGTARKPWLEKKAGKYYEIWWKYARNTEIVTNKRRK